MSNADRNHNRALTALGMSLCAIVIVAWLSQAPDNTKTGRGAAQTDDNQDRDITRLVSAIERFDPWEDTYAQWLMAMLSIAATGISGWAVVLVRDSLFLNRQAVKAAEDAVAETRRIGEAQTRAWVCYDTMAVHIDTRGSEPNTAVSFVWTNSGMSPAINSTIRYVQFATPRDFDFSSFPVDQLPKQPPDRAAPIGPGKQTNSGAMPLTTEDMAIVINRQGRVFYWSEVIYETIFTSGDEELRKSAVCIELEMVGVKPGQALDATDLKNAIRFTLVGPFNYTT